MTALTLSVFDVNLKEDKAQIMRDRHISKDTNIIPLRNRTGNIPAAFNQDIFDTAVGSWCPIADYIQTSVSQTLAGCDTLAYKEYFVS